MQTRTLILPEGYGPAAAVTGRMAAQLDPLLRSLTARVKESSVEDLEWQPRPGVNTVGMLLAHMALSEAYWMLAVVGDAGSDAAADEIVLAALGLRTDDDGMPLAPEGGHPAVLAGRTAAEYVGTLSRARQATHAVVRGWSDADLDRTHTFNGIAVSRAWILFHVVEHFAQHLGQISLLLSLRRATRGS